MMKRAGGLGISGILSLFLSINASGEPLKVNSYPSHTRLEVSLPSQSKYLIKKDQLSSGYNSLNIRFLDFRQGVQEVLPFTDSFERVRRVELLEGGNLVQVNLGDQLSSDFEYFAYRKNNPDRLVIDIWSKKGSQDPAAVAKNIKARDEQIAAQHEFLKSSSDIKAPPVAHAAVQKKTKKAQRKIASKKTVPIKKTKKEFPGLEGIYFDYPFVLGDKFLPEYKSRMTFPDDGFKFPNAYSKRKQDVHYQLAVNLFREGDFALCLKTLDLFKKKYQKSVYDRINKLLRASAMLHLEGIVNDVYYRDQAIQLVSEVVDYDRDDNLNLQAFNFLINEYRTRRKTYKGFEVFSAWAKPDTKSSELRQLAYSGLSELLYTNSRYAESRDKFSEAIKFTESEQEKMYLDFRSSDAAGMYWIAEENWNQASKVLKKIRKTHVDRFKNWPAGNYNLAELNFRLKKYEDALTEFDGFANKFPEHPNTAWAVLRIAEILEIKDAPLDEISEVLKNVMNRFPFSDAASYARARLGLIEFVKFAGNQADKNRFHFTVNQLDKIIEKHKRTRLGSFAKIAKGKILLGFGQHENAYNFLSSLSLGDFPRSLVKQYRKDFEASIESLLAGKIRNGDYKSAVSEFEKNRNPFLEKFSDPGMNLALVDAYYQLGDYEKASDLMKTPVGSKNGVIWHSPLPVFSKREKAVLLAKINYELKNYTAAWNLIKSEAVTLKGGNDLSGMEGNLILGSIRYIKKDWKGAIAWMKPVFTAKNRVINSQNFGNFSKYLIQYSKSLFQVGDYQNMKVSLQSYKDKFLNSDSKRNIANIGSLNKNDSTSHESLQLLFADSYWYSKMHEQAVSEYSGFIKGFPDSKHWGRAKYNLAMSLITLGDMNQGKLVLEEIIASSKATATWKKSAEVELGLLEMDKRYLR